jgi:hypothetical protein
LNSNGIVGQLSALEREREREKMTWGDAELVGPFSGERDLEAAGSGRRKMKRKRLSESMMID